MGTIHFLQHLFGPHLHLLFLFFTGLGTSAVLWPLLLLYSWLVDPVFARRLSIAFAASFLTNRILKEMFNTQRPFQIDQLVSTASAERTATGHGFPSGHSQNAATFYLAFAFFALVLTHVAAALFHALVRRDGVFEAMAPVGSRSGAAPR